MRPRFDENVFGGVEMGGRICVVESRGKMEDQWLETCFSESSTTTSPLSLMWSENCWTYSDDKDKLVCTVNGIIVKLPSVDMEPKPESLWWTSACQDEDVASSKVECGRKN